MTADIDLFAPFRPDRVSAWAEADRLVSVESEFFVKHGFYIERVGEWTLMSQPPGWQDRAIALKVDDIDVLVLHALDLAYNKLEAGRRKDLEFMREGLDCGAYKLDEVKTFVADHAPDEVTRELILKNLEEAAT